MQEEIENKTVTLVVNGSKFSGRMFKAAILGFLRYTKNKAQQHKNVKPQGKQSLKKLVGQNAGVTNWELGNDADVKAFDRVARKYGVDYKAIRMEILKRNVTDLCDHERICRTFIGGNANNLQIGLGISADGRFGAGTEAAVKSFQSGNGLVDDGYAGDLTLTKLWTKNKSVIISNGK